MEPNRVVPGYTHIIGSSSLGSCIKSQVAQFLGYEALPPSAAMQALYDRGHEHENEALIAMADDGWSIYNRQREDVIDCGDGWGVVVHYDAHGGLPVYGERQSCIEVKSPSTWHSFERAVRTDNFADPYMSRISWQCSAQMVASGLECVVACVEDGRVLTFGIEVPPHSLAEIQGRVAEIRAWVAKGELPATCSSADWPCPVRYLHEPDERVELDDPALLAATELYVWHGEHITAREADRKLVRGLLDALDPGRYAVGPYHVTRSEVAGRAKLDEDAMRAAGIDIEQYRVTGKPSHKLTVTRRGEE